MHRLSQLLVLGTSQYAFAHRLLRPEQEVCLGIGPDGSAGLGRVDRTVGHAGVAHATTGTVQFLLNNLLRLQLFWRTGAPGSSLEGELELLPRGGRLLFVLFQDQSSATARAFDQCGRLQTVQTAVAAVHIAQVAARVLSRLLRRVLLDELVERVQLLQVVHQSVLLHLYVERAAHHRVVLLLLLFDRWLHFRVGRRGRLCHLRVLDLIQEETLPATLLLRILFLLFLHGHDLGVVPAPRVPGHPLLAAEVSQTLPELFLQRQAAYDQLIAATVAQLRQMLVLFHLAVFLLLHHHLVQ